MWTTLSRVQENLIKGLERTQQRTRNDYMSCHRVDQNVKLNWALWVLAEEMRKLK